MKTNSIRIQIYVLVPLIFAGLTALAALLTFHLMRSGEVAGGRIWLVPATAGILVATAFMFGLLILRLVFRPVERFLRETRQLVPEAASPLYGRRESDFTAMAPLARKHCHCRAWTGVPALRAASALTWMARASYPPTVVESQSWLMPARIRAINGAGP